MEDSIWCHKTDNKELSEHPRRDAQVKVNNPDVLLNSGVAAGRPCGRDGETRVAGTLL